MQRLLVVFPLFVLLAAASHAAEDFKAEKRLCDQHSRPTAMHPPLHLPTPGSAAAAAYDASRYEKDFADICAQVEARKAKADADLGAKQNADDLKALQGLMAAPTPSPSP